MLRNLWTIIKHYNTKISIISIYIRAMKTLNFRKLATNKEVQKMIQRTIAVNSASVRVSEENTQHKSWKDIPGLPSLPLIGHLQHFIPGGRFYNRHGIELWENLYKMYGPITTLKTPLKPVTVVLFDGESVEQVLRGEDWIPLRPGLESFEYYRKYHNKSTEESLKPAGLVFEQGDNWKQFRSKVSPVLLRPKTVKLYSNVLDEVALDMITRLRSLRDDNNKLQTKFDNEMNLWALESIATVALGCRLNCFDPNLSEDSPARKLVQSIHDLFVCSNNLDIKPSLWKYYSTTNFKTAMKVYEDLDNIAKYFVKLSMEELKMKGSSDDDSKGVLEKLLEIDEDVAYVMACDMLIGGVDTTSNSMSAVLYLLATNQEKQNKLREEITSNQERRYYLKACIKESMRIMPVVGLNLRQTTKNYKLLGYDIPKNTIVMFCHQYLSMMESNFPRPREYIPERWIDVEDETLRHRNAFRFAFSPFGFGVRSCVGRRIAELEMETLLARIIENFYVEWSGPPPEVNTTTLNYVKGPFHFIFRDV